MNKEGKSEKISDDYVTAQVKRPGYGQRSRNITSLSDAKEKRDTSITSLMFSCSSFIQTSK